MLSESNIISFSHSKKAQKFPKVFPGRRLGMLSKPRWHKKINQLNKNQRQRERELSDIRIYRGVSDKNNNNNNLTVTRWALVRTHTFHNG